MTVKVYLKVRCVVMVEKFLLTFVMPAFVFHDLAQLQKSSHGFVQVGLCITLFLKNRLACQSFFLAIQPLKFGVAG